MTWRTRAKTFRFLRRREGSGVLEFALVMPVFLLFVVGIIEISGVLIAETLLEGGVREAARYGITGALPNNSEVTREQQIVNIVNNYGVGFVAVDQANVQTLVYPNFQVIGDPEPYSDLNGSGSYDVGEPFTDMNCNSQWDDDMGLPGLGVGGEIVLYRVDYTHSLMTGILNFAFSNGEIGLDATVAVRNEPYGGDPVCIPVVVTE